MRRREREFFSLFFLSRFFFISFLPFFSKTGHTGQRGIGGDGNKFEAVRAALLAATEADADAARAKLEAAEAEAEAETALSKSKKHGEVAAASAAASSSSSASRLNGLRKAAERTAADSRFPDLPPPPPVVAFDPIKLSLVGELLSDEVLGSLAGVGGGGALLRPNSTTRKSGSGWSNGGVGAVGVPGPALPAMEELGQASGFVLYRTSIPRAALNGNGGGSSSSSSVVSSSDSSAPPAPHHASVLDLGATVHDYGGVFVDGLPVAALDRASLTTAVSLPRLSPSDSGFSSSSSSSKKKNNNAKNDNGGNVTLDILVHEMGRVNFGCVTLDHKGLETDAVTLDGKGEVFFFFFFARERAHREEREGEREKGVPSPQCREQVFESITAGLDLLFFQGASSSSFFQVSRERGKETIKGERERETSWLFHYFLFQNRFPLTQTTPPKNPSSSTPPSPARPSASQPAPRTPGPRAATPGPRPRLLPARRRSPPRPRPC